MCPLVFRAHSQAPFCTVDSLKVFDGTVQLKNKQEKRVADQFSSWLIQETVSMDLLCVCVCRCSRSFYCFKTHRSIIKAFVGVSNGWSCYKSLLKCRQIQNVREWLLREKRLESHTSRWIKTECYSSNVEQAVECVTNTPAFKVHASGLLVMWITYSHTHISGQIPPNQMLNQHL